jgi:hypothetical protein
MPKYLAGLNSDTRDAVDTTSRTRTDDWEGLRRAASVNHIAGQSYPSSSTYRE